MTDRAGITLPVPVLADEVVGLRAWRVGDAEALVAAWQDPDVVAGSAPPEDRTRSGAIRWIEGCDVRRTAGLALDLVIVDAVDDHVLGEVGLARFDLARRAALMGWWVAAGERGRGVATRAVALVADWALAPDRLDALVAEIGADNSASLRVAERCGFVVLRATTDAAPTVVGRRIH